MGLRKFLLCFLLFQCLYISAQEVKGYVFTAPTKLPLANVNVIHKKTNSGTSTNQLGRFSMEIDALEAKDTITFSHVGYASRNLTLKNLRKLKYQVFLTESTEKLSEVSLIAAKKPKLQTLLRYERLAPLKKGAHSFATVAFEDSLWVVGGDESFEEDMFLKRISKDPTLDEQQIMEQTGGDLSWLHYSGKIQSYHISTGNWKTLSTKIRNRAYHSAQLYQNKLYIFGGKRLVRRGEFEYLDDKIEVMDLKTGVIQIDDVNPHQAISFSSFVKGDNLTIVGGAISEDKRENRTYMNALHEYNFTSGYWYKTGVLPEVGNIKGTRIGNYYYVIIWKDKLSANIYSYNLNTGVWNDQIKTDLKFESPAITSIGNTIYLFENNKVYVYDVKAKSLGQYQINLNVKGATLLGKTNKLYVIGGFKETEYSKIPSAGFYRINLSEFDRTKFKQLSTAQLKINSH